jgi:5-methylcytosine-specific restriction enzyme A
MSGWTNSTRRHRLPPNWPQLRQATATRAGGQCQATTETGQRCPHPGTDCDHIQHGDNHHPDNLQWLCTTHHRAKTAAEALAARNQHPRRRPPSPHPGLEGGG